MAHTFTNLLAHVIFSTKDRLPIIKPKLRDRLWAYMGGVIRELNGKAMTIGGTEDHVHLLLWMPPRLSVSETLRVLKTNSSRWATQKLNMKQTFAWQAGYRAFSVSHSNVPAVVRYIRAQEEHHLRVSFQEELVTFLKRNGIQYDGRYIWK